MAESRSLYLIKKKMMERGIEQDKILYETYGLEDITAEDLVI